MSIKATLSSDGLEEVYTAPTLKEMCLYKCLTNKEILTKEVNDELTNGSEKLDWEKYRLKEPIQRELVEALLDSGEKHLFMLTPNYEPVLAAIRMSQPEHLVKVHVNNTHTLQDRQLEWLISGGNVKSLDIHQCLSLRSGSLDAINKFGRKLEYLRIGNSYKVLPDADAGDLNWTENYAILRTPNLKTFIVSEINSNWESMNATNYWRFLLLDFIANLEDLQISSSGMFETLEFLEPARNNLSSLTLRDCHVAQNATAWASLFKLDKLRSLDVIGSSIEEAFVGEDVVQRLLTAIPNLTSLAVDPGLLKDVHVDTSIRGQGSVAKRLEFLGIMEDDVAQLGKAKLLANDVANFGTTEGELRILEYYSNRLNISDFNLTLETLLESLIEPCNTVTVISLLMKIFKNNGVSVVCRESFFEHLQAMFTPDVAAKMGNALLDQCIGAIFAFMSRWSMQDPKYEPEMISDAVDIMINPDDGELRFNHYVTQAVVTMIMSMAEIAMTKSLWHDIGMGEFKDLLENVARLLKKAVEKFPDEINALWGISPVVVVIKELKDVMISEEGERVDLVEIFSSLIVSLRKLCLNSGSRRAAFHSAKGVDIVMEWVTEIIDGSLELASRDCISLFEILKSILQDTKLNLSESGMIASRLEKLLFSLHSKWESWRYFFRETKPYFQLESIAILLHILENDPRYDYEPSDDVKEIMMKLK